VVLLLPRWDCARPATRGWGGGGARLSAESGCCRPEETRVPERIRSTRFVQLVPRSFSAPARRKSGIFPPPGAFLSNFVTIFTNDYQSVSDLARNCVSRSPNIFLRVVLHRSVPEKNILTSIFFFWSGGRLGGPPRLCGRRSRIATLRRISRPSSFAKEGNFF
jgi:hypothetical protein